MGWVRGLGRGGVFAIFVLAGWQALPAATDCATCHQAQAKTEAATPMGHATEAVADCDILAQHPLLTGSFAGYSYEIRRDGRQSIYTVSDGTTKIVVPLQWAFGLAAAGQTYVFERNGTLYESRVSFYAAIEKLDLTMGANGTPKDLDEAAGRPMFGMEARECFGCHNTNAVVNKQLDLDHLVPGIHCERCHGSGEKHMAAVRSGDMAAAGEMRKLSLLNSEETSDFCGQCHRTWEAISLNGPKNVNNVRFQPYRLAKSQCFDADDVRIKCTACHNPHKTVERSATAYDAKCQACHAQGASPVAGKVAKLCPVAKDSCSGCHMPKTELPGAHNKFTDHWIRVVKANEKYPT